MKKARLYSHHHRFDYLMRSNVLQDLTVLSGRCPVDKTMLIVGDDYAAVVEYTDGVMEVQGQESTSFAKMTIDKIQKSGIDFDNKRKFYFRPLYSETLSKSLKEMLHEEGWQLKSLMPWSFYAGNYQFFLDNRKSLRDIVHQKSNKKDFLFLGNLQQDLRPCKIDTSFGTKYPVIHCDIVKNLSEKNFISFPSRSQRILNFEKTNNCKVHVKSNVRQGLSCFEAMNEFKLLVQPHGVSVRHNIYEGMCLGIPSVVERTTYNSSLFSMFPMSDFTEKEDTSTRERIDKIINDDSHREDLRQNMIEYFEQNMLPDSIICSLFKQVNGD